jgi:signal transduction histidine kinase
MRIDATPRPVMTRLSTRPITAPSLPATSARTALPYAAVERHDGVILAASGTRGNRQERWPLAYEQHVEAEAREATTQALDELRRLVHGLRPPALDDLGLVGALRSQSERLRGGSQLSVIIEANDLPDLPAAVEVAVFRTALEAVTNRTAPLVCVVVTRVRG